MDDHDLVRDLLDLAEHVAGDEHGFPLRRERTQEVAQPTDPFGVEAVRRLVEHEDAGVGEQRARDAQALAHPERVAADGARRGFAEAHELEQLVHAPVRHTGGGREHAQMVPSRPLRMEVRRLQHGADLPDRLVEVAIRVAVDRRATRRRTDEPEQDSERRLLARAVRPEETRDRAVCHAEAQTVDGGRRAVALRQVDDLDHVDRGLPAEALDQPPRLRHVRDLELTRDDRPVAE